MKVTVCQNCGGDGFSVALIFCHKCQVYAIHRYCLYKLPATFDEYVTWFCEDCEPEITEPQTVGDLAPRKSKRAHKRKKKKKNKKVDIGDEAVAGVPECEPEMTKPQTVGDLAVRKSKRAHIRKDIGDEAVADVSKCGSIPDLPKSFEDMPKCESNPDLSESVADTPVFKSSPSNQLIEVNCSDNRVKCNKLGQEKGSVQDVENSGEEAESIKCHSSQMATVDSSNISNQDSTLHAQPIVEPVWCGNFRFLDENHSSITGLVAHLSSLACSKVVKESKLLPTTLGLELLPRSDVWPKSFKTMRPTGDNIGLYFFPNNERDEKMFDTLVNSMFNKDFAMRAVVENAELLIFHSTVLPGPYWRFKMKHYLWGLFRAKQASRSVVNVRDRDSREEKEQKRTTASGVQSPVSTLSNDNGSTSPAALCPPQSLVML